MTDRPTAAELEERLDPRDLPRLALFLTSYLHEDLIPVHGSAAQAAFHYAADAELDELGELAAEWHVLLVAVARLPLERVNQLLRDRFHCGWHLTSRAEVEAVAREFERALRD